MPLYNTLSPPPALYQGDSFLVFKADALLVGQSSQQVTLPPNWSVGQAGIRVELDFNQNPGAYEIDVVESSADQNGIAGYNGVPTGGAMTTVITGPNGASTRQTTDLIPVAGQFVALFVKTLPANGGTTYTARITRVA